MCTRNQYYYSGFRFSGIIFWPSKSIGSSLLLITRLQKSIACSWISFIRKLHLPDCNFKSFIRSLLFIIRCLATIDCNQKSVIRLSISNLINSKPRICWLKSKITKPILRIHFIQSPIININ